MYLFRPRMVICVKIWKWYTFCFYRNLLGCFYPWISLVIQGVKQALVLWASPSAGPNIYNSNRRMQSHYTHFFKSTLAYFSLSKECIIFNVDYRPGSKQLKFVMTLISYSPFKYVFHKLSILTKTCLKRK